MALTIGGDKTPPSSRASAALAHTDAAGGPRAQRANSQTPLFSAVLFKIYDPGDDAPGAPVLSSLLTGKVIHKKDPCNLL